MVVYVDSSALLKLYLDENDSGVAQATISDARVLVTSRLTEIEVRRNLTRLLQGDDLATARRSFTTDLDAFALVAIDAVTCNHAARIAEQTLCRSLDAIHLAAARRAAPNPTFLTFDHRQARAAQTLGLTVIGAPT